MDVAGELRRLVDGYQVSQALHVAAVLRLSDLLAAGPVTAADLAASTDTDAPTLYRLLRALSTIGVYHEDDEGRFANTALGDGMRSDVPHSIVGWASFIGRPNYWQAWSALLDSVRTGQNAFEMVHGQHVWAWRAEHPDESAIFDRAMAGLSDAVGRAAVAAYDFSTYATIADIGGGRGGLLATVLVANPFVHGILFDQEHVVAGAGELLGAHGVAERVEVVAGDFFVDVPGGAAAYLLRFVVHDWDNERAVAILRTCRAAMSDESTLLLLERILAGPNQGRDVAFSDLNMLVGPGGRERSEAEYAALLDAAGLRLTRVVPTRSGVSILVAVPVT